MALSIVNNVSSLNAQNNLARTNSALSKSLERLSTGLKINRGADGPAGLVISEQQRAQIIGLRTAIDNTNKAVSLVQTAEGALSELNTLLNKIRGLALDSANSGVNEASALAANQAEITNALATINTIANTTKFGSNKFLLNGAAGVGGTVSGANNANLIGVTTGTSATAGTNLVAITQQGRGASITAAAAGTGALSAAGTLTITGGGLTAGQPLVVNLTGGDNTASVAEKVRAALNNAAAIGGGQDKFNVAVDASGRIAIRSNILGSANLTVTASAGSGAGSVATVTGFSTAGQTSNVTDATLQAGAVVGAALDEFETGRLTISGGGLTSAVTVNLNATNTASATAIRDAVNLAISGSGFVPAGSTIAASVVGGRIQLDSNVDGAAGFSVAAAATSTTVAGAAAPGAALGAGLTGTLQITGGGLAATVTVNLTDANTASAAAFRTAVNAALDADANDTGTNGVFRADFDAGGRLVIRNLSGFNATGFSVTAVAGTATQAAVETATGFTLAPRTSNDLASVATATGFSTSAATVGLGDETGLAALVTVNGVAATITAGDQGLNNKVSIGGANGLSFNLGLTNGRTAAATGSGTTINVIDNSLSFQIGANANENSRVSIDQVTTDRLGAGISGLATGVTKLADIDVTTSAGAQDALKIIDKAITDVSSVRAKLGAFQTNSLESNANNLRNTLENTQSAESVIRDTDFAEEIAEFTKFQTKLQAGSTVLGNANQQAALIAQLLRG
ncbi:MAG: hypothetical protein C0501_16490 [Isosphaera sp.]|nr:hypothetical protein [Isosphaera sp.]